MERRISSPTIFLKSLIHTVPGVQTTPSIVNAATCAKCTACHVSGVNSNNMRKIKKFFLSTSQLAYTCAHRHKTNKQKYKHKTKKKQDGGGGQLASVSE